MLTKGYVIKRRLSTHPHTVCIRKNTVCKYGSRVDSFDLLLLILDIINLNGIINNNRFRCFDNVASENCIIDQFPWKGYLR